MPEYQRVLLNPETYPIPKNVVDLCFLIESLSNVAKKENIDAIASFALSLPFEHGYYLFCLCGHTYKDGGWKGLSFTNGLARWASKYAKELLCEQETTD